MKYIILSAAIAAGLAGCGGDGGEDFDIDKYVGDYVSCDNNHLRRFVTIKAAEGDSLTIEYREKIYEFKDCSGDIKGWIVWQAPATYVYKRTSGENVYGYPTWYKYNVTNVDIGDASRPAGTIQVSGSWAEFYGPNKHCIEWPGNSVCVDPTMKAETRTDVGLIIENKLLYTASLAYGDKGQPYYNVDSIDIKQP